MIGVYNPPEPCADQKQLAGCFAVPSMAFRSKRDLRHDILRIIGSTVFASFPALFSEYFARSYVSSWDKINDNSTSTKKGANPLLGGESESKIREII